MELKQVTCPNCNQADLSPDGNGYLVCSSCGAMFEVAQETVTCSSCQTENPPQAKRCMNCGDALGRLCSFCGHTNSQALQICEDCGSPLDTLAAVSSRLGEGQRKVQGIMRQKLVTTKSEDDNYMAEQRDRFEQEERERLAQLVVQQAAAQEEQKNIILIAVGIVVFIIALGLLILVLTTLL